MRYHKYIELKKETKRYLMRKIPKMGLNGGRTKTHNYKARFGDFYSAVLFISR